MQRGDPEKEGQVQGTCRSVDRWSSRGYLTREGGGNGVKCWQVSEERVHFKMSMA